MFFRTRYSISAVGERDRAVLSGSSQDVALVLLPLVNAQIIELLLRSVWRPSGILTLEKFLFKAKKKKGSPSFCKRKHFLFVQELSTKIHDFRNNYCLINQDTCSVNLKGYTTQAYVSQCNSAGICIRVATSPFSQKFKLKSCTCLVRAKYKIVPFSLLLKYSLAVIGFLLPLFDYLLLLLSGLSYTGCVLITVVHCFVLKRREGRERDTNVLK